MSANTVLYTVSPKRNMPVNSEPKSFNSLEPTDHGVILPSSSRYLSHLPNNAAINGIKIPQVIAVLTMIEE